MRGCDVSCLCGIEIDRAGRKHHVVEVPLILYPVWDPSRRHSSTQIYQRSEMDSNSATVQVPPTDATFVELHGVLQE